MNGVRILGIVLVAAGLFAVSSYVLSNIGARPAGRAEHVYPMTPILGGMVLVTGAILLTVFGTRRTE